MTERHHIHVPRSIGEKVIDLIASFVGSWLCFALHTVWFSLWFVLHKDINLLTLVVSLEAIYLCIILLMSQNRQGSKDRVRDDLEASEVSELFSINQTQLEILKQQSDILQQQSDILDLLDQKNKRRHA